MDKKYIFTIDDNIRFLKELTINGHKSLFSHPYTQLLRDLHQKFNAKIQLNLFYEDKEFNLSQMTDKYAKEWDECSAWLKLSFHSKKEDFFAPYAEADYEQVYTDCQAVQKEIIRFAGENSLAKTTTIHFCKLTRDGLIAIKNNGVKGLLGLYEDGTSYQSTETEAKQLCTGQTLTVDGIGYAGIDIILNCFTADEIIHKLSRLHSRNIIKIMIHEQYFYQDYSLYQRDFGKKLVKTMEYLRDQGYQSAFFGETLEQ